MNFFCSLRLFNVLANLISSQPPPAAFHPFRSFFGVRFPNVSTSSLTVFHLSYLAEAFRAAVQSPEFTLEQHVLHAVPSAVVELVQGESRARRAIRLRGQGETWCHAFLKAQQRAHEDQIAVAHLRLADEVVVAYCDRGKGHVGSRLLVQHGDAVVLEVVDGPVGHLQQEGGQGHEEDQSPQALAEAKLLVLHKHMVGAVERAVAEERGQVVHPPDALLLFLVCLALSVQEVQRLAVPVALLHSLVAVVEGVLAVSAPVVVVGGEGDGAHDPDRHGGGVTGSARLARWVEWGGVILIEEAEAMDPLSKEKASKLTEQH